MKTIKRNYDLPARVDELLNASKSLGRSKNKTMCAAVYFFLVEKSYAEQCKIIEQYNEWLEACEADEDENDPNG